MYISTFWLQFIINLLTYFLFLLQQPYACNTLLPLIAIDLCHLLAMASCPLTFACNSPLPFACNSFLQFACNSPFPLRIHNMQNARFLRGDCQLANGGSVGFSLPLPKYQQTCVFQCKNAHRCFKWIMPDNELKTIKPPDPQPSSLLSRFLG